LYGIWWTKYYFNILDNLCKTQKVVLLFIGGQKFQLVNNVCGVSHLQNWVPLVVRPGPGLVQAALQS
jgi:hypothetical protein